MDISKTFDRTVVINLKRRPDRLLNFYQNLKNANWPFALPSIFEAIDGTKVSLPTDWKDTAGTWGCLQSHRQIIEKALIDDVESILIMEDDVTFVPDFKEQITTFLQHVPADWEGLMIGGQHFGDELPHISNSIVRCHNTQRMHCYALRGRKIIKDLYSLWMSYQGHCDHVFGPFIKDYNVYAPYPFLAGQDEGYSDVTNNELDTRFWRKPDISTPIVHIDCPSSILEQLSEIGFYFGKNPNRVDPLLDQAFCGKEIDADKLWLYINKICWQAYDFQPARIPAIWHPLGEDVDISNIVGQHYIYLDGDSFEDIRDQWKAISDMMKPDEDCGCNRKKKDEDSE